MRSLYDVRAKFLPDTARVLGFEGEESLSALYTFRVTLGLPLADALELDLDGATGQRATLRIHDAHADSTRLVYHGIVAAFHLLDDSAQVSMVRLDLVPELWNLSLGEHSRVFVNRSLRDIVAETLTDGGLTSADFALRLADSHRPLEYVCQYRESRLAFLTRWFERVGARYFFEQGPDREKVIVSDRPGAQDARSASIPFQPVVAGHAGPPESLWTLRRRSEMLPRRTRVTGYNYSKPLLEVTAGADIDASGRGGDVRSFDTHEDLPEKARDRARTVALQYLARRTTYRGDGSVVGLAPGLAFSLHGHPRHELNRRYLVTEVRHRAFSTPEPKGALSVGGHGQADEVYRCELGAVEAEVHWVPSGEAIWPTIRGTVRARVDGTEDSEYAQIDDHGRYLVRLLLDESRLPDGGASSRVRMLQAHGGEPEGWHLPLRKGTEVQVAFVGGDPDLPVILGAVPNATTPSPVTRANYTQNVLQTGGMNRLEIEDQRGAEYLQLSSPSEGSFLHMGAVAGRGSHNYVWSTQGDFCVRTGGNLDVSVGGRRTEAVAGNVDEAYRASQDTVIDGSLTETIGGGFAQSIQSGFVQTIDGGMEQTVSGDVSRSVVGGEVHWIDGGRTRAVTGSCIESVTGPFRHTISGDVSIATSGAYTVAAAGDQTWSAGGAVLVVAKGGFNVLAPGGQQRFDSTWTQLGKDLFTSVGVQFLLAGHRIDLRGLHLEAFASQVIFAGLKWAEGLDHRQSAMFCLDTEGIGFQSHIFSQNTAGFHVWGS